MCAVMGAVCFGAAYLFRDDRTVKLLLLCLGAAPILLTCVAGGYLAYFRPEMLHQQEYEVRSEKQ